jgi:hypothetical protein
VLNQGVCKLTILTPGGGVDQLTHRPWHPGKRCQTISYDDNFAEDAISIFRFQPIQSLICDRFYADISKLGETSISGTQGQVASVAQTAARIPGKFGTTDRTDLRQFGRKPTVAGSQFTVSR